VAVSRFDAFSSLTRPEVLDSKLFSDHLSEFAATPRRVPLPVTFNVTFRDPHPQCRISRLAAWDDDQVWRNGGVSPEAGPLRSKGYLEKPGRLSRLPEAFSQIGPEAYQP
jgi:hypothetical protein